MEAEFNVESEQRQLTIYLLISLLTPSLLAELFDLLLSSGVFGAVNSDLWLVRLLLWSGVALVLGYFLVFRKNHEIAVKGSTLTDTFRVLNQTKTVYLSEIKTVKRGFLGEIVLKNEDGKTLLTVEKAMTNYEMFIEYLRKNNFKEI